MNGNGIALLGRNEIDINKYDLCIENAINSRVYAFSWYLDVVADDWDVLVLEDYRAVMPLPKKKKYGFSFYYQPVFSQQLGFFSYSNDQEIQQIFEEIIPWNKILLYNFNSNNRIAQNSRKSTNDNFEINLNESIVYLRKNYRKDRLKSLRKARAAALLLKDGHNIESLVSLYKETFSFVNHNNAYYEKVKALLTYSLKTQRGVLRSVYLENDLVASAFFFITDRRIYYVFGASNIVGKQHGATTLLIDSMIEEYSESKMVFDFEGSSITNVASFYSSFGAVKTKYQVVMEPKIFSYLNKIRQLKF